MIPAPADIIAAAYRLRGIVTHTPLRHSDSLSEIAGRDVFLKCENEQVTGSFKLRGAYNALATLPSDARERGVVASSAGNHGLGIAHAARLLGLHVHVFMPSSAPRVKRDGIVALGARVDESQPHYDAAHHAAVEYARQHGMTFVNPCAGEAVLAGQGTVALEILEELPSVKALVVPVGGGGLVGGVAALMRAVGPDVRIVGAQGANTNAMAASLSAGRRVDVEVTPTLADGLAGQIDDEGFAIGQRSIDEMRVVSESEIAAAIAWMSKEHGARVEGSGACGLAAVLGGRSGELTGPIVIIVSGGNIDAARWSSIVQQ